MMRTVWIINQYASTPETGWAGRSYYLAKELANQGYNVYLIASSSNHLLRNSKSFDQPYSIEAQDGFTFVWVRMPNYSGAHSKQRVLNWFLFSWRILKLRHFIKNKPDAILCSSPSLVSFLGAQRLARKFGARLVFEVRDIWPLTLIEIGGYSKNHPFVKFLQWVEDKAYRDADAVVSNLKNSVEHMADRGMNRDKFAWIPNGFCKGEVQSLNPLDGRIATLIPEGKFIVGYTGTFGLANDLFTLLRSASLLQTYPDILFVLVGGGKDKGDLLRYAKELGLSNVLFLDFIEKKQIQSVLTMFDVLAVGAKKEPMYRFGVSPNKLFDYLISGKPIIYHIASGDYHPINDVSCGYEVEPENAEELADAILRVYRMPVEERILMGANGRKSAVEKYEYGQLANRLAEVLFGYKT